MNPEIKQMWVAALRSGEYKQTSCLLNGASGFCCLGVLCDLHAKTIGGKWDEGIYAPTPRVYLGNDDRLPESVMRWSGVQDILGGVVKIRGENKHLSTHNDDGRTFDEIADAIEEQL